MIVASAYYALGKFESALEAYQRAGDEMKKKITASSPEYIVHCTKLFNNMGCVYFEMKKYDKAMKTWQRALELCNDGNEDYASWTSCVLDQASIMNNMVSESDLPFSAAFPNNSVFLTARCLLFNLGLLVD